jgi:hypothetical protein
MNPKPELLKIDNLNQAQAELNKIKVHPVGVQIMALKAVYRIVKFEAVDPKTANIIKQEMLSRGGDVAVAGTIGKFEEMNTDIIIMGTLAQYIRLVRKLKKQSCGCCMQIASVLEDLLFKDLDVDSAPVW